MGGRGDIELDREPHLTDGMLEKYCCEISDKQHGETLGGRPRFNANANARASSYSRPTLCATISWCHTIVVELLPNMSLIFESGTTVLLCGCHQH